MTHPTPSRWSETRRLLREDRARIRACYARHGRRPCFVGAWFPGYLCTSLYRLSHCFWTGGGKRRARWFWLLNVYLTGADIAPRSTIGGGLRIPHPAGISVDCRAGSGLTVMACACISPLWRDLEDDAEDQEGIPLLGDNVHLGHHAVLYGAVRIGDEVQIPAGVVVVADVPVGTKLSAPVLKVRPLPKSRAKDVASP